MKTIGQQLKDVRKIRKKTIEDLSSETRIKKKFIELIEEEQWSKLPEFPVVVGFVKSISNALEINTANVVSLLKRDYPPQQLLVNPKPEIREEFSWGPRLTFIAGVVITLIAVVSYLIFQYFRFLSPPNLRVDRPVENQTIVSSVVEVSGQTDPDVTVIVNDQPAFVDEEGNFYTEIEVSPSLSEIDILARSRSSRETTIKVPINIVKLEE